MNCATFNFKVKIIFTKQINFAKRYIYVYDCNNGIIVTVLYQFIIFDKNLFRIMHIYVILVI